MAEAETIVDGRYRLLSRIGSGGMADVFLAEDRQLGRQVALKVLYHRFAEDQEFVERFRREASSAAGLSHPNVVSIFDRGEWNGTYYIAMEYLPGRSLKTIVREHGALDPVTAIDLVVQILHAARFAHQHGTIHRDLKPHNVIVDDDGRVRVTDFGIARAGASDMTQTGSIMGTAQYLSPEQAQGHAVSASSDLYSIGIVLYELLTGTLPFDGDTAVTIALKQVSQEPTPPSAINPAVTPALDAIVLRALAKDPAHRFADATEFMTALEEARSELPVDSASTARFAAVGAAVGGPGPPLIDPPLAFAAAPVLPPATAWEGPPPETVPPGRRRPPWGWIIAGVVLLLAAAAIATAVLLHHSQVTVPGVRRCELRAVATTLIKQAGLKVQATPQSTTACPSDTVVSESPPGGSRVNKGSTVTLAVSTGPGITSVPLVTGLGRTRALRTLSQAGFHPIVQEQPSSTVTAEHVISTNPPAGTEILGGSDVMVTISSGAAPITVPDVTGISQADAKALLQADGLRLGTVRQQPSQSQPPGSVISESPSAGTSVPKGTAVNLVVAKAPPAVSVPNVVGQHSADATATLAAAGFQVNSQSAIDPAHNDLVLKEQPPGGHKAKPGSTVTIVIGATPTPTTPTTPPPTTTATPPPTTTTTTTPLASPPAAAPHP